MSKPPHGWRAIPPRGRTVVGPCHRMHPQQSKRVQSPAHHHQASPSNPRQRGVIPRAPAVARKRCGSSHSDIVQAGLLCTQDALVAASSRRQRCLSWCLRGWRTVVGAGVWACLRLKKACMTLSFRSQIEKYLDLSIWAGIFCFCKWTGIGCARLIPQRFPPSQLGPGRSCVFWGKFPPEHARTPQPQTHCHHPGPRRQRV